MKGSGFTSRRSTTMRCVPKSVCLLFGVLLGAGGMLFAQRLTIPPQPRAKTPAPVPAVPVQQVVAAEDEDSGLQFFDLPWQDFLGLPWQGEKLPPRILLKPGDPRLRNHDHR